MRHGHAPNLGTRWPGHGRVCAAWRHERLALFGSVHAGRHLLATGRRGLRGGRRGLSIFPRVPSLPSAMAEGEEVQKYDGWGGPPAGKRPRA